VSQINPPYTNFQSIEMKEWWPWYRRIANEFGYNQDQDQDAAETLSQLLKNKSLPFSDVLNSLNGRKVIVFGAGPSLETDLMRLVELDLLGRFPTLAADGATSALLNVANTFPDIIVSDLDGPIQDLQASVDKGSKIIIHAHGDNVGLIKLSVRLFNRALGSTQVEPRINVFNFGGFTDGDRAVFLATAMHASTIIVAGMDFGKTIGSYSKVKVGNPGMKLRKLQYGKLLLEWLAGLGKTEYCNVTRYGERIAGFRQIEPEQLQS